LKTADVYLDLISRSKGKPYDWLYSRLSTHFKELNNIPTIKQVAIHCINIVLNIYKDDPITGYNQVSAIMDASEDACELARSESLISSEDGAWGR